MTHILYLLLVTLTPISVGAHADFSYHARSASDDLLTPPQVFAMQKIRQYCTACHGLGKLRFIFSDDNVQLWKDIQTLRSPKSQSIWAEEIIKVLSWPSNSPPSVDQLLQAPDKDWMPKGKKRLDMAADIVDGYSARQAILDVLN